MGLMLARSAAEVGCSERTLRRHVDGGLLRGRRVVRGQLELSHAERAYLRDHWSLLCLLLSALRTERDVRLAVLFGSTATGEDTRPRTLTCWSSTAAPSGVRRRVCASVCVVRWATSGRGSAGTGRGAVLAAGRRTARGARADRPRRPLGCPAPAPRGDPGRGCSRRRVDHGAARATLAAARKRLAQTS